MSSSVDSYANGIYNRFQHHAAWPPNTTLRIGDIGTLEGHLLRTIFAVVHAQRYLRKTQQLPW